MELALARDVAQGGVELWVHGAHSLEPLELLRLGVGTDRDETCWVKESTVHQQLTSITLAHETSYAHARGETVTRLVSGRLWDKVDPGDRKVHVTGRDRLGRCLLRMGADTIAVDETHGGIATLSDDGSHTIITLDTAARHAHPILAPVFILPKKLAGFFGVRPSSRPVRHQDPNRQLRYQRRTPLVEPPVLAKLDAIQVAKLTRSLRAAGRTDRLATGKTDDGKYTYSDRDHVYDSTLMWLDARARAAGERFSDAPNSSDARGDFALALRQLRRRVTLAQAHKFAPVSHEEGHMLNTEVAAAHADVPNSYINLAAARQRDRREAHVADDQKNVAARAWASHSAARWLPPRQRMMAHNAWNVKLAPRNAGEEMSLKKELKKHARLSNSAWNKGPLVGNDRARYARFVKTRSKMQQARDQSVGELPKSRSPRHDELLARSIGAKATEDERAPVNGVDQALLRHDLGITTYRLQHPNRWSARGPPGLDGTATVVYPNGNGVVRNDRSVVRAAKRLRNAVDYTRLGFGDFQKRERYAAFYEALAKHQATFSRAKNTHYLPAEYLEPPPAPPAPAPPLSEPGRPNRPGKPTRSQSAHPETPRLRSTAVAPAAQRPFVSPRRPSRPTMITAAPRLPPMSTLPSTATPARRANRAVPRSAVGLAAMQPQPAPRSPRSPIGGGPTSTTGPSQPADRLRRARPMAPSNGVTRTPTTLVDARPGMRTNRAARPKTTPAKANPSKAPGRTSLTPMAVPWSASPRRRTRPTDRPPRTLSAANRYREPIEHAGPVETHEIKNPWSHEVELTTGGAGSHARGRRPGTPGSKYRPDVTPMTIPRQPLSRNKRAALGLSYQLGLPPPPSTTEKRAKYGHIRGAVHQARLAQAAAASAAMRHAREGVHQQ